MRVMVSTSYPGLSSHTLISRRFDEFISLGFGRPGTAHPGNSNDQIFLRNRLAQHGSPGAPSNIQGDMLIVSQIRLACIGREADRRATLVFSRSRTASVDQHILTSGSGPLNLLAMLEALNTELDDWYKTWIWAGKSLPEAELVFARALTTCSRSSLCGLLRILVEYC